MAEAWQGQDSTPTVDNPDGLPAVPSGNNALSSSTTVNDVASHLKDKNLTMNDQEMLEDSKLKEPSFADAIPAVDIEAIGALEHQAKELEKNLHRMMQNVNLNMSCISSYSVQYAECYRECVKNIGNASDASTKAVANLIGKCEEMNRSMEPLYSMAEQIRMIKLLLDQLEDRSR